MAFKLPTMARETSTTTSTGDMLLAGAVSGYFAFSSKLSDQDTCWLTWKFGTDEETGLYTYNAGANSFTRTTIYSSTNGGSAVNWGPGTKDVSCDLPGPSDIPVSDKPYFASVMAIWPRGYVNKFRNGTFDLWHHGVSGTITTSGAFAADGWFVQPTGASVTFGQGGAGADGSTYTSLFVTGNTSVTDVLIRQRIESYVAAALANKIVTVQAKVFNLTGGTITPTLTVKHAGTQDSWGSPTTDVSAVSLQPCANNAWTQVAYTFSCNAAAYLGLEVDFDFGNNFSSNAKTIYITEADIEPTANLPIGLCSNPPPPELRPISVESSFCERYFQTTYANGVAPGTASTTPGCYSYVPVTTGQAVVGMAMPFRTEMRASPTITWYSPNSGTSGKIFNSSASSDFTVSSTVGTGTTSAGWPNVSGGVGTAPQLLEFHMTANAEM